MLGKGVGVWEISYQFYLISCCFLNAESHYLLDKLLDVLLWLNNLLINPALEVAVDVGSRNMSQHFEMLTLLGQLEDLHKSEIVDLESILDGIIEVHRGCAVHDDVNIVNDQLPLLL